MRNGTCIGTMYFLNSRNEQLGKGSVPIKEPMLYELLIKQNACGDGNTSTFTSIFYNMLKIVVRRLKFAISQRQRNIHYMQLFKYYYCLNAWYIGFQSCFRSFCSERKTHFDIVDRFLDIWFFI